MPQHTAHQPRGPALAALAFGVVFSCLLNGCLAQLSLHTDANTNSFTLQTPSLQQSFTRYYGGSRPGPAPEQAQQQDAASLGTHTNAAATMGKKRPGQNSSTRSRWLNTNGSHIEPDRYEPKETLSLVELNRVAPQYAAQQQQQQQQQQVVYAQQFAPVDSSRHNRVQYRLPSGAVHVPTAFGLSGVGFGAQQLQQAAYAANGPAGADIAAISGANANEGAKPKRPAYSALQQRLQHLQQQQQQLPPPPPPPPSYSEQMQAAFASYQQQQQQQQHLLQQLYEQYPQIPFSQVQEGNGAVVGSSMYDNQNLGLPQGQFQRQPYYSTQQHAGFLQRQQDNILRDQHKVLNQHYNPAEPSKGMQMYGMAVPESSVANPSAYSPASEVSHVNFSSGNVKYTF